METTFYDRSRYVWVRNSGEKATENQSAENIELNAAAQQRMELYMERGFTKEQARVRAAAIVPSQKSRRRRGEIRLSGAGQRRLAKNLKLGLSWKEARARAVRLKPIVRDEDLPSTSETVTTTSRLREEDDKISINPEKRLSGAAKKRMAHWMSLGYSREDAKIKALTIKNYDGAPRLPESANMRRRRLNVEGALRTLLSSQDESTGIKIAILPRDYPNSFLTSKQRKVVEEALYDQVKLQKGSSIHPQFFSLSNGKGCLIANCKNKATAQWTKVAILDIMPWNGASLYATEEDKIPHDLVLMGYFPNSERMETTEILAAVQSQNSNLNVNSWRCLSRSLKDDCVLLQLAIDKKSVDTLERIKCKINFNSNKVRLWFEEREGIRYRERTWKINHNVDTKQLRKRKRLTWPYLLRQKPVPTNTFAIECLNSMQGYISPLCLGLEKLHFIRNGTRLHRANLLRMVLVSDSNLSVCFVFTTRKFLPGTKRINGKRSCSVENYAITILPETNFHRTSSRRLLYMIQKCKTLRNHLHNNHR